MQMYNSLQCITVYSCVYQCIGYYSPHNLHYLRLLKSGPILTSLSTYQSYQHKTVNSYLNSTLIICTVRTRGNSLITLSLLATPVQCYQCQITEHDIAV